MFQKTQMTMSETLTAVGYLPIQDSLSLRAWLHPDKKLFTFLDDEGIESDKFTYLDLWQRAQSVADYLVTWTEPGDRVLLFYPQGLDFIAAFFGCLLSNRIAVPISLPTRRRVDKCVSVILDSGAMVAMAPQKTFDQIADSFEETEASDLKWIIAEDIPVSRLIPSIADFRSNTNLDDVAFLQYTSGSTSTPKGVMVTYRNITLNLQMMRDSWSLDDQADMVFWQPHHHDMGLIMGQLLPVLLGNHTVIMSPNTAVRQPAIWLQAVSRYQAKLTGGPNFIYDLAVTRYSEERLKGVDLSCWEIAPNGADVVRLTTLERFYSIYKKYGFRMETFMPCYGLAEGTLFVTGGPTRQMPRDMEVDKNVLEKQRRVERTHNSTDGRVLVGCGEPNWGVEVAIAGLDTGKECGLGEVGEIWVSAPTVAAGYWRNEEATQKTFHGVLSNAPDKRFLRTGDIGFIGDDNQLYICGRLKDLIICEGRNLHPEDIEYTILQATDKLKAQSCAVFSYDKDDQRQAIVAIIETDRELMRSLAAEAKELRSTIGQSITDAHGIGLSHIVFIPPATLKKTTSGKVQRSLMKNLYLSGELEVLQT
jgi:acyl-CoA synthetase (AMP-forming)/AMP-acid ligase II